MTTLAERFLSHASKLKEAQVAHPMVRTVALEWADLGTLAGELESAARRIESGDMYEEAWRDIEGSTVGQAARTALERVRARRSGKLA